MNVNPLLKYVIKDKTADVAHTSGYAQAANRNGATFGSTSTTTYADRQRIQDQRKFVRGYNNSRLAGSATPTMQAKTFTPQRTFTPPTP